MTSFGACAEKEDELGVRGRRRGCSSSLALTSQSAAHEAERTAQKQTTHSDLAWLEFDSDSDSDSDRV